MTKRNNPCRIFETGAHFSLTFVKAVRLLWCNEEGEGDAVGEYTYKMNKKFSYLAFSAMFCVALLFVAGGLLAVEQGPINTSKAATEDDFDIELAREINYTCTPCHGDYGQGAANGEYPRLAGLEKTYIAGQLRLFKARKRMNIPMFPYATERELPEEDVQAISRYLSSIRLVSKLPPIDEATYDPLKRLNLAKKVVNIRRYAGDAANGRKFYNRECANCHGRDGLGKKKMRRKKPGKAGQAQIIIYPRLAGQHSLYLWRQIKKIGKGERFHDDPEDQEIFASFSKKEIRDALAYLSILDD